MQKYNHIKALLFLGIFSMFLLHKVVPHLHHQHEVEHTYDAVEYNTNHSHHHDTTEKESHRKGFLDMFLEMHVHVHSIVSNEILLTYNSSIKQLEAKKVISTANYNNHYSSSINDDEALNTRVYHPPHTYFNPYLSSLDSRGPPSLG